MFLLFFLIKNKKTPGFSKAGSYKLELHSCGHLDSLIFFHWVSKISEAYVFPEATKSFRNSKAQRVCLNF